MTRIIPTVIIHLTGKEQLIKNRKEKKKRLRVRGGVCVWGEACQPVLNQDPHNENFFPFEEAFFAERAGMTKLK